MYAEARSLKFQRAGRKIYPRRHRETFGLVVFHSLYTLPIKSTIGDEVATMEYYWGLGWNSSEGRGSKTRDALPIDQVP